MNLIDRMLDHNQAIYGMFVIRLPHWLHFQQPIFCEWTSDIELNNQRLVQAPASGSSNLPMNSMLPVRSS